MKTTKKAKALLSVVLVLTMLFSMCVVGFIGVSAADLTLNYEFAYKNAGYAEGRISLTGGSGTYYLYWADDTKALDGYAEIATITAGTKPFEMDAGTAIPAGATKVIAISGSTEPAEKTVAAADAVFDVPADKQFKGGSKEYTFEALSDIHIQVDDSYWYLSKPHFANALEVAADREVDFMTICGDMVNGYSYSNLQNEYPQYLKLIAASNYNNPIYETNGNHEMKGGSNAQNLDLYRKATGLNTTTGKLQSTPYYEKTINGDHYIFLVLELSGSPNESSEFTTAQLDWFEGLLKKYYNDGNKIIVNQHALIKGYGAGDDKVTPYYGGHLQPTYAEVRRLMDLMEEYPDIIMMSGHSHIDFKYGYNFDNEDGNTCYTVHIPSTSSTTHPKTGGGLDYKMDVNSSQGYLVDVYNDYVILNGTDLAMDEILPAYTYMVDYTGEELEKNEMDDIVYDTVKVTVDVSNLTNAPTEVICTAFNAGDATDSDTVAMQRNSDGTYSADIIDGYSQMYFIVKSAAGQLNTSAFEVANCKITLGYNVLTYPPTGTVTENVNAHFWGSGGDGTVWPGVAMTKDSSGNYVLNIPASEYTGVVFNEGASPADKTTDLDIAPYITAGEPDVYVNLDGGDVTEPTTEATKPATQPTETTEPTEPVTQPTEVTEPTEATEPSTAATEPVVDELAPIVIIEKTDEGYFLTDAYAADGSEDVEFKFAINGVVYQDYSDVSTFIFDAPHDYLYVIEVSAKYSDGTEHKTTVMIEVKDGEALLPDMPERPTAPQTQPTETTTAPTTTATVPTTSTPEPEYLYGDADLNGKVNVKDATTVQKYAAKIVDLDETAFIQADVTGDMKVNVKDATSIQKLIAKIITVFPVEEGEAQLAAVGATVADLKAEVKTVLSTEYQYASYDAYMALKKAYMNANVTYDALNSAYTDYKTMKSNNVIANYGGSVEIGDIDIGDTGSDTGGNTGGSTLEGECTVYFSNTNGWGTVYAHLFGTGGDLATWPGAAMTDTGITSSSGKKLYKITFDSSKYQSVVFNAGSGGEQTVDIKIEADGTVYHLSTKSGEKYTVGSYAYSDKY